MKQHLYNQTLSHHPIYNPHYHHSTHSQHLHNYLNPSHHSINPSNSHHKTTNHPLPSSTSYLQIHSNRILSALKKDHQHPQIYSTYPIYQTLHSTNYTHQQKHLKTHQTHQIPHTHLNNQHLHNLHQHHLYHTNPLFPSTDIIHKPFISHLQTKFIAHKSTKPISSNTYPYSFTQYQQMKSKINERNKAQDHWLETQLSRIKRQDQLIEAKQKIKKHKQTPYLPLKIQNKRKVKQIFNEVRQQLKSNNTQTNQLILLQNKPQLNPDIYHSFIEQTNHKPLLSKTDINRIHHMSSSEIMSLDTKQKKSSHLRQKYKNIALKEIISHHIPINPINQQANSKRQRKSEPRDRYRYVSETSQTNIENNSMSKSQHISKYDYAVDRSSLKSNKIKIKTVGNEKVTEQMVNRAFVFDQLNECESDFQEDDKEKNRQVERISKFNKKKSNNYKDSLEIVYDKLYKTPERFKESKEGINIKAINSNKQSNKSQMKQQHRYDDLLVSIQRKKLLSKSFIKPNNKLQINQKQTLSSILINSTQPQPYNQNENQQQKIQYHKEMEICNKNKSAIEQYPIFSPYAQQKYLSNQYLTTSLERRKLPKQYGALGGGRREEDKRQYGDVKNLIVDEIEKRKIESRNKKQKQDVLRQSGRKEDKKEGQNNEKKRGGLKQGLNDGQKRESVYQCNDKKRQEGVQGRGEDGSRSEQIGRSLRIELQILKQQLQEKNRRVVDLELQVMMLRGGEEKERERKREREIQQERDVEKEKDNQNSQRDNEQKQRDSQSIRSTRSGVMKQENGRRRISQVQTSEVQIQTQNQRELTHSGGIYSIIIKDQSVQENEMMRKVRQKHKEQIERYQEWIQRYRSRIRELEGKVMMQQEGLENLLEDMGMYQKMNQELERKVMGLEQREGRE